MSAVMLELAEGCELVMDGELWQVERLEPYWGKVTLRHSTTLTGGCGRPRSQR